MVLFAFCLNFVLVACVCVCDCCVAWGARPWSVPGSSSTLVGLIVFAVYLCLPYLTGLTRLCCREYHHTPFLYRSHLANTDGGRGLGTYYFLRFLSQSSLPPHFHYGIPVVEHGIALKADSLLRSSNILRFSPSFPVFLLAFFVSLSALLGKG